MLVIMKGGSKRNRAEAFPGESEDYASSRALAEHSAFFDSLVELVPAKYYFEREEPLLNLKYMKKAERAQAKRALKEQYRKNKRAKLDPNSAQTALEVQRTRAELQSQQPHSPDATLGTGSAQVVPQRLSLQNQSGRSLR